MLRLSLCLLSALVLGATSTSAQPAPAVVASIKPIHALVAAVMRGVGEPHLIVEGAGSPHAYALKPSQAAALEKADLVFWIGHELEPFLEKPIETIARKAMSVELMDAPGLVKLAPRAGGAFEAHDQDKARHDDHDRHGADPHVWLDPLNAKAMIAAIEAALTAANPARGAAYAANAAAMMADLDALTRKVAAILAPVRTGRFIVFHDGYQYFENRFGLAAAGAITVSPEVMPGAARIGEIQARLKSLNAACVFAEPQFEPKLVSVVIGGTAARAGVLDPLGAALDPGPDLYAMLIRNMATSFRDCLAPPR